MAASNAISIDLGMNKVSAESLQDSNKIPVIVVQMHKEVAYHIRHVVKEKKLSQQDLSIIHFDAHPVFFGNVNVPADFAHRIATYDASYSKNWLLPMAYAGYFNKIAWFRPPWSNSIPDGSCKWIAGKDKKTGYVRLNSKLELCIYEQMYRNEKDMTNTKEIDFHVITMGNKVYENEGYTFVPDDTEYIKAVLSEIRNKPYILDINIDYFTCYDPHFPLYKEANMYERISRIYESCPPIRFNPDATDEEIYDFMEKRSKRLSELEYVMACFDCDAPIPEHIEGYDELMALKHAIDSEYSRDEINWDDIHKAGLTIVDSELPDFIPRKKDLHVLYHVLEETLDNLVETPPFLITIAWCHNIFYTGCGAKKIAGDVVNILQKKFKNLDKPNFTYQQGTSSDEDTTEADTTEAS